MSMLNCSIYISEWGIWHNTMCYIYLLHIWIVLFVNVSIVCPVHDLYIMNYMLCIIKKFDFNDNSTTYYLRYVIWDIEVENATNDTSKCFFRQRTTKRQAMDSCPLNLCLINTCVCFPYRPLLPPSNIIFI